MLDEVLTSVEAAVLETALDPDTWPDVLEGITDGAQAFGAVILPVQGRVPGVPGTRNSRDLVDTYFRDGWAGKDKRELGLPKLLATGLAVEQDFVTEVEMNRDPFWQEFLGAFDLRWSCLLKINAGSDIWCLSIQRTIGQGLFTTADQQSLARLISPLSRAASFLQRLAEPRLDEVSDALAAFNCAAMLLSRTGTVTQINPRARALIEGELKLARGELSCRDSAAAKALRQHIDASLWAEVRPDSAALQPVAIPRPGRRPLILQAHRLSGAIRGCFAPAVMVLLITDPDEAHVPRPSTLRVLFGLTDAEARLACVLGQTFDLQAAAAQLGIAYNTARSQLQAVFAKTGSASQAELVALMSRIARAGPG